MEISREIFDQQRRPQFGNANPERMKLAFWEWMIRGAQAPSTDGEDQLEEDGPVVREGIIKSGFGPYRARDLFNIPVSRDEGPIWTFERMGATRIPLPDGRIVCIAGEHEDFYDPDFYIYNDVVVLGPSGQIEIYGYPKEVFPPTDFHTATLAYDQIVIIGCVGYKNERRFGYTPVYSLNLSNYRISEVKSSGEMPGWISKHEATYDPNGGIIVRRGELIQGDHGQQRIRRNYEEYSLDMRSGVWRRLTNRNWLEFSIRREKGAFILEKEPTPQALLPRHIEYDIAPCRDHESLRIVVAGIPVSVTIRMGYIRIVIEGEMPEALSGRLLEEIRSNAEGVAQGRCILVKT
jgi:hypothetical protein